MEKINKEKNDNKIASVPILKIRTDEEIRIYLEKYEARKSKMKKYIHTREQILEHLNAIKFVQNKDEEDDKVLEQFHYSTKAIVKVWKQPKGEKIAFYRNFEGDFSRENVKKVVISQANRQLEMENRKYYAEENIEQLEALIKEFSRDAKLFETMYVKDRLAVAIPFKMKDSLKKAVRSSQWDGKYWTVGRNSHKKLEAWIEKAYAEFDVARKI